jgi:nucleotide-binding universal stress UspA family protein
MAYGRILVPLDGSSEAERNLESVRPLLAPWGTRLILLRAVPPLVSGGGPYAPLLVDDQQEAAGYLRRVAARLEAEGIRVEERVRAASLAAAIPELAREERASLILLGLREPRGLDRLMTGGFTRAVLREAFAPILSLLPPAAPGGREPSFRKILVPAPGARVPPLRSWAGPLGDASEHVPCPARTAPEIVRAALAAGADLIVVPRLREGFLGRPPGPLARRLLRTSPVPLLFAPLEDPPREEAVPMAVRRGIVLF